MNNRGFTLIEMLVSVAIFTVVMVVALGALLSLSEADRKAETLTTAVNNMSAALDGMARAIRTGTNYHCSSGGTLTSPLDCTSTPSNYFTFEAADGTQVAYCLSANTIWRQIVPVGGGAPSAICASSNFLPLTASTGDTGLSITSLDFYVLGSPRGDGIQPKVTILINGSVPVTNTVSSVFNLETSVTQRTYDE